MHSKFNNFPSVKVVGNYKCFTGWNSITDELSKNINEKINVVVVETYHGVRDDEIISNIKSELQPALFINAKDAMLAEEEIQIHMHS